MIFVIEDNFFSFEYLTKAILKKEKTNTHLDSFLSRLSKSIEDSKKDIDLITDYNSLVKFIIDEKDSLYLKSKTSGTTGLPKDLVLKLSNVIKKVKIDSVKRTWACFYPIQSYAFSQIFFQSFLNGEKFFYLYDKSYKESEKIILEEKITHVGSTPTLFTFFLNNSNLKMNSVESVILGGEKFRYQIKKMIEEIMPNADLKNVYASTETGSLLKSNNEYFTIESEYSDRIKIENNQIFVRKEIVNINLDSDEWYATGDYVNMRKDGSFSIIGRDKDFINVFGNRVCLGEVEDLISNFTTVSDVIINSRKNQLAGNIITAEVVLEKDHTQIDFKKELNNSILRDHEKPLIVNFVENLVLSKSGKKKR